jgi:hypothetical protein
MENVLAYALQVLGALPQLLVAGQDVLDLVEQSNAKLEAMQDAGRDPTPAEWKELDDMIDELQILLHEGEHDDPASPAPA